MCAGTELCACWGAVHHCSAREAVPPGFCSSCGDMSSGGRLSCAGTALRSGAVSRVAGGQGRVLASSVVPWPKMGSE